MGFLRYPKPAQQPLKNFLPAALGPRQQVLRVLIISSSLAVLVVVVLAAAGAQVALELALDFLLLLVQVIQ